MNVDMNVETILNSLLILFLLGLVIYQRIDLKRQDTLVDRLVERNTDLTKQLHAKKDRSDTALRSVIRGQMAEKFFPFNAQLKKHYKAADMIHNGILFDYIIFNGYTDALDGIGEITEIILVDVKSGNAKLLPHQEQLKNCIMRNAVYWETWRIDEDGTMEIET